MNSNDGYDEVNSGGGCSKHHSGGRKAVPLRVDALTAEEWSYLRGLFLTDGCSLVGKVRGLRRDYRVLFYLGGNEEELTRKVVELLRRAGLHPYVQRPRRSRMVLVIIDSKSLYEFLPRKKLLAEDSHRAEEFLEENRLLTAQLGVSFFAGLLDGDGHCAVRVTKRSDRCFSEVRPWRWTFAQKKLRFLVGYVHGLVESLVPGGARKELRSGETDRVVIRKAGIEALLAAGVASYSVRVSSWLRRSAEARGERAKYLTVGQVARILHVARTTVRSWLEAGLLQFLRKETWYYIPNREVEKL